jgi:hypothetical protein
LFPTGQIGVKVPLALFVAKELLGIDVDPGTSTVVPFNQVRADVRAANLIIAAGGGKSYKAPKTFRPPDGVVVEHPEGTPLKYLPRGVTMCSDRNQIPFTVRLSPTAVKVNATALTASHQFRTLVVPELVRSWGPAFESCKLAVPGSAPEDVFENWEVGHAHYTSLLNSYESIVGSM